MIFYSWLNDAVVALAVSSEYLKRLAVVLEIMTYLLRMLPLKKNLLQ